jgi:chloride channel protein, CIC family
MENPSGVSSAPPPEVVSPQPASGPSTKPSLEQLGIRAADYLGRFGNRVIRGLALREGPLFLLLSGIIGLASGFLVVCFHISIEWIHLKMLGSSLRPPVWRLLLFPTVSGLTIAAAVMLVFKEVRGSGVNQTKAAVYIYDGYISFRTVVGKFLLCALALGSGQSLGPEDPSLQIGAGVASVLGRYLHLSREKIRMLAPVGAAAGLAAAFNAPISASLFVLEEVVGQWNAGVLGAIILGAVASAAAMRAFLGADPLFRVPSIHRVHAVEFLAYCVLGVVGGFAGVVFIKLIAFFRPRLKALPKRTQYFQPAIAGLVVGVIALGLPQVVGPGYYFIDQAMHDQYVWQMLALLAIFKLMATLVSFVSGTPGGMFAPALFIGAMIGGAVGGLEHLLFPSLTGPVGVYALVGMGTMFAAFLRVPLTSVFMVLELSGNYSIILPVMVANTLAYLISRNYDPVPLFDILSRQDGIDLPSVEEQREETELHVEDAMRRADFAVLDAEETVREALQEVIQTDRPHFLVNMGNGVWTLADRKKIQDQAVTEGEVPLRAFARGVPLPWVHPDQRLDAALRLIGNRPLLPVLSRSNLNKLEGVVSLDDILKAYGEFGHGSGRS